MELYLVKYMIENDLLTFPLNINCINDPSICYKPSYKNTAFIKIENYNSDHLYMLIQDN